MEFIINNLEVISIIVLSVAGVVAIGSNLVLKSKSERYALVLEWLASAVVLAEKRLGSKKGEEKVELVWELFVKRFPILGLIISKKKFKTLVDEALDATKETIEEIKEKQNKLNK